MGQSCTGRVQRSLAFMMVRSRTLRTAWGLGNEPRFLVTLRFRSVRRRDRYLRPSALPRA